MVLTVKALNIYFIDSSKHNLIMAEKVSKFSENRIKGLLE